MADMKGEESSHVVEMEPPDGHGAPQDSRKEVEHESVLKDPESEDAYEGEVDASYIATSDIL